MRHFTRTSIGTGLAVLEREDDQPQQKARTVIESNAATYTLEELLGVGGMGEVWKARCTYNPGHRKQDRVVTEAATKFVTGMDSNEELKDKLVKEARLTAQLNHENIVGFRNWDYLESKGTYFIVMEYVKGMDANRLMQKHGIIPSDDTQVQEHLLSRRSNRIPDKLVGFILFSMANALDYAHNYQFTEKRGVFHRDISPGNILIKEDEGSVKLGDFGIAATPAELEGDDGGIITGKLPYISPEGITDMKNVDARSDIYSLGMVMYEMLTGLRPNDVLNPEHKNFNAQVANTLLSSEKRLAPPHEIVHSTDERLSWIICRMLETKKEKRFQTADELRHAVGTQFIYEKGYGPTKFGLRDYLQIQRNTGNRDRSSERTTKTRNLGFLKDRRTRQLEIGQPLILTEYARKCLESGKNPARLG